VAGLRKLSDQYLHKNQQDYLLMMELILHALVEFNLISRDPLENGISFKDPLSDIF
jgi:hypothetical protein